MPTLLIIIIFSYVNGGWSTAVTVTEFDDFPRCIAARQAVQSHASEYRQIFADCVKK